MPLALDQRADGNDQRSLYAELRLAHGSIRRCECRQVDARVMHKDTIFCDAQRHQVVPHRPGNRKQPIGAPGGVANLPPRRAATPEMNVCAARLDRNRHPVSLAERDCGRAVGKEEFGVDHVECEFGAKPVDHGRQGAEQRRDMKATARAGDRREPRPPDVQPFPALTLGLRGKRVKSVQSSQRKDRQADRRDDLHLDRGKPGKTKRLTLHEHAEIRPAGVGKQG